jgi:cell wall-associated NlpC family hydrolase
VKRLLFILILVTATFGVMIPSANASTTAGRLKAWAWAITQNGDHYRYGATGPNYWDCSALVQKAYKHAGFAIPRTTYLMEHSSKLYRIPRSQARRGDLAFFGTGHVELYEHSGNLTFGASGHGVGYHHWSASWHPTMFYRVKGAG